MARRGSRFLAGRASNPLAARFREIERAIRRRQRFNTAEVTTIVNNAISGGGGGGGGSAANTLIVDDEGIQQGVAERMDFVGGGVTATVVGSTATIEVPCPCECDEELVLTGGYWLTPDDASLDITGDIDLRAVAAMTDWTPAVERKRIVTKWGTVGALSYDFELDTTGMLRLAWSEDGTIDFLETSSVAPSVADGGILAVRAILDVDNGAGDHVVRFYTKATTPASAASDVADDSGWTQLGTDQSSAAVGVTSIFAGTGAVAVAADGDGTNAADGIFYAAIIKDGIDGTTVADPDFYSQPVGTSSFVDGTAKTWTLEGQSAIPVGCLGETAVYDEGAFQGTVKEFDFVGSSVAATVSGERATVTFSGGGGSGYALVSFSYIAQGTTTYTVPAGIDAIMVECIGAGGGGGGAGTAAASSAGGGGAGGGGYASVFLESLDASYACVVGAGGAGGAAGNNVGSAGTDTTFDSPSVCTATGGLGGPGMAATTTPSPSGSGAAGAGTVGDLLLAGQDGGTSVVFGGIFGVAGPGGMAARGGGGPRGRVSVGAGLAAGTYGGGGSGGLVENGSAAAAGGAGGDGRIIVWEYAAV